ncbi:unnamed protein product [Closterium sp. NIES-65]|nr:unnamed protein product [Closterium sp. NIES-65]
MGSMRAFPAGLLLLAFALIATVQMMKAAHGDDSVRSIMTHHRNFAGVGGKIAGRQFGDIGFPQFANSVFF